MSVLNRFFCILLLLFLAAPAAGADPAPKQWPSRPAEIRSVWMDRRSIPKTEQGIRDLVRMYAKAGINVIHPEAIYNGCSAYRSSYLSRQDLWEGTDMLGVLIDEAHRYGIEVHPWVWVFRAGNADDKGGILKEHPDWVAIGKDGKALTADRGYWLCPSIPAARRLLLGAIRELVEKYPVDGIQLDYIRFPGPDYCYNESCRRKFKAEHGIDPLEIEPFTKPILDWHLWRENLVNTFVADVSAAVKKVRPDVKVSAAVGSVPDQSRLDFLQDWEHWAANKWVDFVSPMDYTCDAAYFRKVVSQAKSAIADRTLLAPGIGLHMQSGAETMLEQVCVARSEPVSGVALFSAAYLNADRLNSLRHGPFKKKALASFRSPVEAARRLISSARDRLKNDASPNALSEADPELASARGLLKYASYRALGAGYLSPTPPPIFIPDRLISIPQVTVPMTSSAPVIDGRLDDPAWQRAAKVTLDYTNLGAAASQPTEMYLAYDTENLYIAFRCCERELSKIKAEVAEHDGPVFYEDSVEIFLDIRADSRDYYEFAINARAAKYDAHTGDAGFDPAWQAAAGREQDAWTAEMSVPFSAFKLSCSPAGGIWRVNFCRNRAVMQSGSDAEHLCWSPTYGSFHTPIRFGKLVFAGEGK